MKRPSKNCVLVLVAFTLLAGGTALYSQAKHKIKLRAWLRADETLEIWNAIGNKLVAMAEDFLRTSTISSCRKTSDLCRKSSARCAVDYDLMRAASGSKIGPTSARTSTTRRETITRRKPTW